MIKNILKNIFENVIAFLKKIKSPYLFLLVIFDFILFYYYLGRELINFAFIIAFVSTFALTTINEIFRKNSFLPITISSLITILKIIFEFYFIAEYYAANANLDNFGRLIQNKNLMFYIIPIIFFLLLDLIISMVEIFRTNKFEFPLLEKMKRETSSTISLILILFSGLTFIFTLYVAFLMQAQSKFYPIYSIMPYSIGAFIISLISLLVTKKGKIGIILYQITLGALFSLSCVLLIFDLEVEYFPTNTILVFVSLYVSNILFSTGCLFFRQKQKAELN